MCLAVPGRVESISDESGLLRVGVVDFSGIKKRINLGFLETVALGDYVLVHAGVAISSLSPSDAAALLRELDTLVEEEPEE